MQYYLRKIRVDFPGGFTVNPGGMQDDQLKVGFRVIKDISSTQNDGFVDIWNLKEGHRNAIGNELEDLTIEAGYLPPGGGGNVGIITKAQIRDVEHRRDGTDIITRASFGDGDRAARRATIAETFSEGTSVDEIVEALYGELEAQGVDRGEIKLPEGLQDSKRPISMCGSCFRELDLLGRSHGFYWSVQNGAFEVIPSDGYLAGVAEISQRTGMVGVPTITDNGIRVSTLMNPEIRPGRRIEVESETIEMNGEDGRYRVSSAEYVGDNYSSGEKSFVVTIHGESQSGDKIDDGRKE